MNTTFYRALVIVILLLIFFFAFKAEAQAPTLVIIYPVEIQGDNVKQYAYNQVRLRFGENHWNGFNEIINHESRWKCNAQNPTSSAYGLGGFLNSTWKLVGFTKTEDCYVQVQATIAYIEKIYKDPIKAWAFWQANDAKTPKPGDGWY